MKSTTQSEELTPAVGKLIYSAITSLDGYIEDENGNFDWAEPDEEVFAFVNELERPIGIYLYGRRMYETMAGWETDEFIGDRHPVMVDRKDQDRGNFRPRRDREDEILNEK
jgi:dihydrofolate reductase